MLHWTIRHLRQLAQMPVDFIYPPLCLLCDNYLRRDEELICRICFRHLPQLEDPDVPGTALRTPLHHPPCFDRAISLFPYQDSVGAIIHFFKYRGGRALASPLGKAMGQALLDGAYEAAALIPVPLHAARQRERGYNQSALLARAMAAATGIPVWPAALQRTRATLPQARMGRKSRLQNLRGVFAATDPDALAGSCFVLVDDVLTTGHTLDECARVLLQHGASRIIVTTIARVL